MKKYWVSWYHKKRMGGFELESPWWVSGCRCSDDATTICAALMAESLEDAENQIYTCYDKKPKSIEFRFIDRKDDTWIPFCDRFRKADWMKWSERKDDDKQRND